MIIVTNKINVKNITIANLNVKQKNANPNVPLKNAIQNAIQKSVKLNVNLRIKQNAE
jgi:hypothetical protein